MEATEKIALLFNMDDVRIISLAIAKFFEHVQMVRTGKVEDLDISAEEIEDMLAEGEAHIIDEAMLKDIAKRLKEIEEPRSVYLVYLSMEELQEVHTVIAIAIGRRYNLVSQSEKSPALDEVQELGMLLALAERFDNICEGNKK